MTELNFQIHSQPGGIPVKTFREAIYNAIYLLREFDAGISKHPLGTLAWYVNKLNSNGSLSVNFVSRLRSPAKKSEQFPDISLNVTNNFLTGFEDIEDRCVTPPYLSEYGLQKASELSRLIESGGATGFRFAVNDRAVEVTPKTAENVSELQQINRTAVGSVEGMLEEINVHRKARSREQKLRSVVYHSSTNRAITCLFEPDKLETVKDALGHRVIVFGELQKNLKGETMRVVLERLEIAENKKRFQMPDVGGVLGVPDFENAETTEEYMRRIRGG